MLRRSIPRPVVPALIMSVLMGIAATAPVSAAPPANDAFANATSIASLPFSGTSRLREATSEPGEPDTTCNGPNDSVWYTFKPSTAMTLRADTLGSDPQTSISVYRGSAINALTEVDCNYQTLQDMSDDSSIAWAAQANVRYRIQVVNANYGSGLGTLRFHLTRVTAPANDRLPGARVINSLPFQASYSNRNATNAADPPNVSGCAAQQADVWFRFTSAKSMYVQFATLESDYDTTLSVFRGSTLGTLVPIICNDNSWGGYSGRQSLVTMLAVKGVTYSVQVGGSYASSGQTKLTTIQVTPPANDAFARAKPILPPSPRYGWTFVTRNATKQPGEPTSGCVSGGGPSLWYRFTASDQNPDNPPKYNIAIRSDAALSITVYHGTTIGSLVEVACAEAYYTVPVTTPALIPGDTYFVQVAGSHGDTGPGGFEVWQVP